jgi:hypothetical protein
MKIECAIRVYLEFTNFFTFVSKIYKSGKVVFPANVDMFLTYMNIINSLLLACFSKTNKKLFFVIFSNVAISVIKAALQATQSCQNSFDFQPC